MFGDALFATCLNDYLELNSEIIVTETFEVYAENEYKYGTYSEKQNSRLASGHNQKPVTTNFTGCKPNEIYADFVFIDDSKYLIKCKNNCVPEERVFLKTWVRKEVSWKSVGRAKQLQYMQTEEFSEYAKFRNGVEAIPSLLRRRYHVDKIPVHGKKRTRLFFGFKMATLDFQKLLDYTNSLDSYASNKKTA